jgi:hypothetical protein
MGTKRAEIDRSKPGLENGVRPQLRGSSAFHVLAMAKVEGSSPFIRFREAPARKPLLAQAGICAGF